MKINGLITLLFAFVLLCSGPSHAVTVLTDPELARVSSGGVDPHIGGQSLPQDQQQPDQSGTASVPNPNMPDNDVMDIHPQAITVLQSTINIDRKRHLLLDGKTQQDLYALNLENVIAADVIEASNIYTKKQLLLSGTSPELFFIQTSRLDQLHRQQGSLHSSDAAYSYEKTVHTKSGSEDLSHYASYFIDQQDRTEIGQHHESVWDVEVSKLGSPYDLINNELPLTLLDNTLYGPFLDFPEIGGMIEWFGVKTGATADYTGFTFSGFGYDINSIYPSGYDLVIGSTVTLPMLDFGSMNVEGCILDACTGSSVYLGTLGGAAIDHNFTLNGLAPQFEEWNMNTGFVLAGEGKLELLNPVTVKMGGEASLEISAYAGLTLDLSKVELFGVSLGSTIKSALGANKWDFLVDLSLLDATVPFTVVDLSVEPFDIEFNGIMKAEILGGTGQLNEFDDDTIPTDEMQHTSSDYYYHDKSYTSHSHIEDVDESSFSESLDHTVFHGGHVTSAEAELLALSEGTLSVSNSSNVSLSAGVQKNMRVLHAVNAVSSVAANSANIGQAPSFVTATVRKVQISMHQQNYFNQQL